MEILVEQFDERLAEIDTYLDLLTVFEGQIGNSGGVGNRIISATQQRILYSSVYLQLYSLVEATLTKCTEALCSAVLDKNRWMPADLSPELRKEWVRYLAKTHSEQNYENRLNFSLKMFDHLIKTLPVDAIKIEKGNSGNWHDEKIYKFAKRLGCSLKISQETITAVKKTRALMLIVEFRNKLAHGNASFEECGANVTVSDLKELRSHTEKYMREVVISFKEFIENYAFLQPESRPNGKVK